MMEAKNGKSIPIHTCILIKLGEKKNLRPHFFVIVLVEFHRKVSLCENDWTYYYTD